MARTTLKAVNAAIKAAGGSEELVPGKGYFYFWSDEAALWPETSVAVYRLNHLTLEQWFRRWHELREQHYRVNGRPESAAPQPAADR